MTAFCRPGRAGGHQDAAVRRSRPGRWSPLLLSIRGNNWVA